MTNVQKPEGRGIIYLSKKYQDERDMSNREVYCRKGVVLRAKGKNKKETAHMSYVKLSPHAVGTRRHVVFETKQHDI